MSKKPKSSEQTSSRLAQIQAGQWTKSEKREAASRGIMESKKAAHRILKAMRQDIARLKF
jgi:hypothetical protein